jgi:SulP family sulfate permease
LSGPHTIISGCTADVYRVLRNSGLLKQIGEENLFPVEANPTISTRKALLRAKELLPGKNEIRLFYPNTPAGSPPDKSDLADYMI